MTVKLSIVLVRLWSLSIVLVLCCHKFCGLSSVFCCDDGRWRDLNGRCQTGQTPSVSPSSRDISWVTCGGVRERSRFNYDDIIVLTHTLIHSVFYTRHKVWYSCERQRVESFFFLPLWCYFRPKIDRPLTPCTCCSPPLGIKNWAQSRRL